MGLRPHYYHSLANGCLRINTMACYNPILVQNLPNLGKRKFLHWEFATDLKKLLYKDAIFDCLKCIFCRKKSAYNLAIRCVLHASLYKKNSFITLTYDETKEDYHNQRNHRDIELFIKKLRSYVTRKHGHKIEIFKVHEYGKNGKKHWHLACFGYDYSDKECISQKNGIPLYKSNILENQWGHGICSIGNIEEASAMYLAQYMEKDIKNGNTNNSKKAKSHHKGIGLPYFMRHYRQILSLGYIPFNNTRVPIPRSFERRAHKHYCHFYDTSYFFDTLDRKRWYTPFRENDAIKDLADLYIQYKEAKTEQVKILEREWDELIQTHLETGEEPDFIKFGQNLLYDMKQKQLISEERF